MCVCMHARAHVLFERVFENADNMHTLVDALCLIFAQSAKYGVKTLSGILASMDCPQQRATSIDAVYVQNIDDIRNAFGTIHYSIREMPKHTVLLRVSSMCLTSSRCLCMCMCVSVCAYEGLLSQRRSTRMRWRLDVPLESRSRKSDISKTGTGTALQPSSSRPSAEYLLEFEFRNALSSKHAQEATKMKTRSDQVSMLRARCSIATMKTITTQLKAAIAAVEESPKTRRAIRALRSMNKNG